MTDFLLRAKLEAIATGTRVVVRYSLPQQSTHRFTDALGVLISQDADQVFLEVGGKKSIHDSTGKISISVSSIVAIKEIPPAPVMKKRIVPRETLD